MMSDMGGKLHVLLVEDDPDAVDVVSFSLAQSHPPDAAPRLSHAGDLASALPILGREHLDVILLDLNLPDCDGVATVTRVHERAKGTPIVVLSAEDDNQLAVRCIETGAWDYVVKGAGQTTGLQRAMGHGLKHRRELAAFGPAMALAHERMLLRGEAPAARPPHQTPAIHERSREDFAALVLDYAVLLRSTTTTDPHLPKALGEIADRLAALNARTSDLLDLHLCALERVVENTPGSRAAAKVIDSRQQLLALLGLMVDKYALASDELFSGGLLW